MWTRYISSSEAVRSCKRRNLSVSVFTIHQGPLAKAFLKPSRSLSKFTVPFEPIEVSASTLKGSTKRIELSSSFPKLGSMTGTSSRQDIDRSRRVLPLSSQKDLLRPSSFLAQLRARHVRGFWCSPLILTSYLCESD